MRDHHGAVTEDIAEDIADLDGPFGRAAGRPIPVVGVAVEVQRGSARVHFADRGVVIRAALCESAGRVPHLIAELYIDLEIGVQRRIHRFGLRAAIRIRSVAAESGPVGNVVDVRRRSRQRGCRSTCPSASHCRGGRAYSPGAPLALPSICRIGDNIRSIRRWNTVGPVDLRIPVRSQKIHQPDRPQLVDQVLDRGREVGRRRVAGGRSVRGRPRRAWHS